MTDAGHGDLSIYPSTGVGTVTDLESHAHVHYYIKVLTVLCTEYQGSIFLNAGEERVHYSYYKPVTSQVRSPGFTLKQ